MLSKPTTDRSLGMESPALAASSMTVSASSSNSPMIAVGRGSAWSMRPTAWILAPRSKRGAVATPSLTEGSARRAIAAASPSWRKCRKVIGSDIVTRPKWRWPSS